MHILKKIEDLIALEHYNELDRLNQLELARIGRSAHVALPPSPLARESLVP